MLDHSRQSESDFQRAHFKAFLGEIAALIARRPNELLSFDAVRRSLKIYGQNYRGIYPVPLAQIVGTATLRYHDFNRAFLPTQTYTKMRWRRVDEAYYEDKELPPVQLYKIGEVYFVRDGHHRVSVAHEQGRDFIDAEVIEVKTRVPLSPDLTAADLEIVGEYSEFIEKTRIDKLRPAHAIQFSEPGGYARLLEQIAVHRYFLGEERQRAVTWEDAVTSWYDQLYHPLVHFIRAQNILADFPRRTETDLYLWIMDHHYFLNQNNNEMELEQAALDFAQNFSQRLDKKLVRAVRHAVGDFLGNRDWLPLVGSQTNAVNLTRDEEANE
ncbi:MAG: hypothetical protein HY070_12340 [Chloroflexi bacterium]|nr:hypothetical protein [Chloroflexota bacterium]